MTRQVRSIDIALTVLALLQIEPPKAFQGSDLIAPRAWAPEAVRYAVSNLDGGGVVAIRSTRWKLIRNHLFDLREDPGETRDVAARFPEVAALACCAPRRPARLATGVLRPRRPRPARRRRKASMPWATWDDDRTRSDALR